MIKLILQTQLNSSTDVRHLTPAGSPALTARTRTRTSSSLPLLEPLVANDDPVLTLSLGKEVTTETLQLLEIS